MSAPSGAPHDHLLARFKGTHVRLGRPRPHESLDLLARLVLSGGGSLWRRVEIGGDHLVLSGGGSLWRSVEIGGDEIGGDDELLDRCAHDGARHLPALLLGDLLEEIILNGVLQSTAISGTQRYSAGAALANQAIIATAMLTCRNHSQSGVIATAMLTGRNHSQSDVIATAMLTCFGRCISSTSHSGTGSAAREMSCTDQRASLFGKGALALSS